MRAVSRLSAIVTIATSSTMTLGLHRSRCLNPHATHSCAHSDPRVTGTDGERGIALEESKRRRGSLLPSHSISAFDCPLSPRSPMDLFGVLEAAIRRDDEQRALCAVRSARMCWGIHNL
jgi:hypothetical protein